MGMCEMGRVCTRWGAECCVRGRAHACGRGYELGGGGVEVSGFMGALGLRGLCSDLCFLLVLLKHDCAHAGLPSGRGPELLHL